MSKMEEAVTRDLLECTPGIVYCLQCVGDWIQAKKAEELNELLENPPELGPLPEIWPMVTSAPGWQMTQIGPQTMFACVPLPACARHIDTKEKTSEQKAIEGGLLLGRPGGM